MWEQGVVTLVFIFRGLHSPNLVVSCERQSERCERQSERCERQSERCERRSERRASIKT